MDFDDNLSPETPAIEMSQQRSRHQKASSITPFAHHTSVDGNQTEMRGEADFSVNSQKQLLPDDHIAADEVDADGKAITPQSNQLKEGGANSSSDSDVDKKELIKKEPEIVKNLSSSSQSSGQEVSNTTADNKHPEKLNNNMKRPTFVLKSSLKRKTEKYNVKLTPEDDDQFYQKEKFRDEILKKRELAEKILQ